MTARVIALIAASALAASAQPEHLLQRIRERMARNLAKAPNYTCLQSIDRSERRSSRDNFRSIDRVKLEVALLEGRELFSWPGAGRFDERDLGAFLRGGVTATGDYALHAHAIFISSAPRFEFAGEEDLEGRRAWRYRYEVSSGRSGYEVRSGEREVTAAYHGSFWADVDSLDVLRLDVIVDSLPEDFPMAGAATGIHYARTRVGQSDFLLPQRVEMVARSSNGTESRNRTVFANCHQYVGESTISFEEPAVGGAASAAAAPALELPAGLTLETKLDQPIDFATVAMGDTVTATVVSAVKKSGRVLVPKGAVIEGQVRVFGAAGRGFLGIGVRMMAIRIDGASHPLTAELTRLTAGMRSRDVAVIPPEAGQPAGTILVRLSQFSSLPRGFPMSWTTLQPKR